MALDKPPLHCYSFPRLKKIQINVNFVGFPTDFQALSSVVIFVTKLVEKADLLGSESLSPKKCFLALKNDCFES